jgi:hypothetical protein
VSEPSPREFRYKITSFVDGVMAFDERVLRYQQGLRKVQVPYANIRRFGVRTRPKTLMGVVTSELLLLTEPSAGRMQLVRVAFDPTNPTAQEALAALRGLVKGADADTTKLPWVDAAPRLGVKVHGWTDAVLSRWGVIGISLVAGAAGVAAMQALTGGPEPAEVRLGRGIVELVAMVVGVGLLVIGYLRTRVPKP